MIYNWQHKDWPDFKYQLKDIEDDLIVFVEKMGRISGLLDSLTKEVRITTVIELMVTEALKTTAIEGEYLTRRDVISSIRRNLGLTHSHDQTKDKRAEGIAELMISIRDDYSTKLTQKQLFEWHRMIMKGSKANKVGAWRTHKEPMQVISGSIGKVTIHFEAPQSDRVPYEMKHFINWFNDTIPDSRKEIHRAPVRAAIAHIYFESIHPFEDGNGRMGRALSEKALSQGVGRPVMLSLSRIIESGKKDYYNALKEAQQSNEITSWIRYFVQTALAAQVETEKLIEFILYKTRFFDAYKGQFNERQLKVIRRMLEEGPEGFTGGVNATKYMSIVGTSKPTATRDLQELLEKSVLNVIGAGRSTRYEINFEIKK